MAPGAGYGASEPPRAGAHPTIVRRATRTRTWVAPRCPRPRRGAVTSGRAGQAQSHHGPSPDPRPALLRCVALSVASMLVALPGYAASESVGGASGLVAAIDAQSGRYEIRSQQAEWTFAGRLAGAAAEVGTKHGQEGPGVLPRLGVRSRDRRGLPGRLRASTD